MQSQHPMEYRLMNRKAVRKGKMLYTGVIAERDRFTPRSTIKNVRSSKSPIPSSNHASQGLSDRHVPIFAPLELRSYIPEPNMPARLSVVAWPAAFPSIAAHLAQIHAPVIATTTPHIMMVPTSFLSQWYRRFSNGCQSRPFEPRRRRRKAERGSQRRCLGCRGCLRRLLDL